MLMTVYNIHAVFFTYLVMMPQISHACMVSSHDGISKPYSDYPAASMSLTSWQLLLVLQEILGVCFLCLNDLLHTI